MSKMMFATLFLNLYIMKKIDETLAVSGDFNCSEEPFKFMVNILKDGKLHCAGSLVNERYMLTSASCCTDITYAKIRHVSTQNETEPIAMYIHPYFDNISMNNDIAVVKLQDPFPEDHVGFVTLPGSGCTDDLLKICKSKEGNVVGSGHTHGQWGENFRNLSCATLPIISKRECSWRFDKISNNVKLRHHQMCVRSTKNMANICQKDEGGPILCNGVQVGVISRANEGCGMIRYPVVFARVDCHLKFIYTCMMDTGGKEFVDKAGVNLDDMHVDNYYDATGSDYHKERDNEVHKKSSRKPDEEADDYREYWGPVTKNKENVKMLPLLILMATFVCSTIL